MLARRHVVATLSLFGCLVLAVSPALAQKPKPKPAPPGGVTPTCVTGCIPPYKVTVTPDGANAGTKPANTGGYNASFTVRNDGTESDEYNLNCDLSSGTVNCTGLSDTYLALAAGASQRVFAYYDVGNAGPGSVVLRAMSVLSDMSDNGSWNVTAVAPPGAPIVALRNQNGDNVDRSLCLTSGAGEAAAWQCGDLIVTHGLPGYSTLGRDRSLSLLYTSAQAVPKPVVAVAATEGGNVLTPDSVHVELLVNGAARATATYNPWGGMPATTRQLALTYDASNDSTGIYPFTLLVRNKYATGAYDATVTGNLIVVNRTQSQFAAGWSLAGVERLYLNQGNGRILWVGGDGSARVYDSVAAGTWRGAAGAFRDTLRYDVPTASYTRALRHGVRVVFDAGGRHVQTLDAVGRVTTFFWTTENNRLDSISVPPAGQARTTYRLYYDGAGKLDRLVDPVGRALDATVSGNRLIQLVDPDSTVYHTDFGYDAAGRMTSRTTRRGYATTFAYAKGLRVTQVKVPLDPTTADTATSTFTPWDERGLANATGFSTAVDTATAYTKIDGPLTALADSARFWIDRWGGPVKVASPVGATATITRGDPVVPALVTRLDAADGAVSLMKWDLRGNPLEQRDSTAHLGAAGQPTKVSRRTYNAPTTPDSPDSLIDSTGTGAVVTRFGYNTWGLTDSVIDPTGHVIRAEYITDPASPLQGLVRAIVERALPVWNPDSLREDVRDVRAAFALNPYGNVVGDTSGEGRVRVFTRDTAQRVAITIDAGGHTTETNYDALNRPTRSIQTIEGGVQLVARQHYTIDVLDSIIDPRGVLRRFAYDAAGRQTVQYDDYGKVERVYYNRAGLVDSVRQRVFQDSTGAGRVIRVTYDAVGRVLKRAWPVRTGVLADSVMYTYDLANRVLTATTAGLRETFTYFATGAVNTDVLANLDGSNPYSNAYGYDRLGRRAWYRVGSAAANDSVWYSYDVANGQLKAVGVRWSTGVQDSVRFWWDAAGRRDTLLYTNGTKLRFAYDGDGQQRLMCGVHPDNTAGSSDVFDLTVYQEQVDAEGMILKLNSSPNLGAGRQIPGCGSNLTATWVLQNTYDARHQLRSQSVAGNTSTYTYDFSGNVVSFTDNVHNDSYIIDPGHDRVIRTDDLNNVNINYRKIHRYDPNGARLADSAACNTCNPNITYLRYYYYEGLGRTSGVKTGSVSQLVGSTNDCSFDPLGRLFKPCETVGVVPRLGYDGQNVVRTQADGNISGWTFVHGPGLDDPLMGYYKSSGKYVYYVTDGFGGQYAVGEPAGWDYSADLGYTQNGGKYAGGITNANGFAAMRFPNSTHANLAFFRNRFYDLTTNRWTQEDPMGLAGGMNLYSFAGNNPVSFTDPYGTFSLKKWLGAIVGFAAIVVSGGGLAPALLATAATAAGSAVAAGVESLVTGTSFMDAFRRNFNWSEGFLGGSALAAKLFGGGVMSVGANGPFQGFVQSRTPIVFPGGFTMGSGSLISGAETMANGGVDISALMAHELGHTYQFIALSGFGNPWGPYAGLGALGLASELGILHQPGAWWETMASLWGRGGQCAACVMW